MCVQFTLVEEFSGNGVELTVFSDDENSVMGQVNGPFRMNGDTLVGEISWPQLISEAADNAKTLARQLRLGEVEVYDPQGLWGLAEGLSGKSGYGRNGKA